MPHPPPVELPWLRGFFLHHSGFTVPAITTEPPQQQLQEMVGIFRRINWSDPAVNEGRRYIIGTVDIDNGETLEQKSIKGTADVSDLLPGIKYRFFGKWGKEKARNDGRKFPQPFEFAQYVRQEPHTRGGMCQYIQKVCPGFGYTLAGKLWDAFGPDAAKVLRTDPARVRQALPKIPAVTIEQASEALKLNAATEDVRIELASLFEGRGFTRELPDLLIKKWGIHAPRIVRHDPFKLMVSKLKTCGFNRCDRLYMDLGLPPDRLKRQFACLWRALQEDSNGHTWFSLAMADKAIRESISGVSSENLNWKRAVKLGVRAGWLSVFKSPVDGSWWITERKRADAEERLQKSVAAIMQARPPIAWPEPDSIHGATDHQRDIARSIFLHPIAILGGSPGTGKTTFTAMVLRELCRVAGAANVAVVAPTNAAAARMRQSLERCQLGGVSCGTIHGTLGVTRNGRDKSDAGWGFYHKLGNPLPFKVIAIEESSMVGTEDAADLFDGIAPGTLVLVIGDHHQLMPVSHGAVLRDLRAAGIPHAELTEVLRNGGDGLQACRSTRDGRQPSPSRSVDLRSGGNWCHVHAGNGRQAVSKVVEMATKLHGLKIPAIDDRDAFTVEAIRDIQVIVALNDKGDANRKSLNEALQKALNPHGRQVEGVPFRQGDKVIASEKAALQVIDWPEGPEVWDEYTPPDEDDESASYELVVKGEIGRAIYICKAGMVVEFMAPHRMVWCPRKAMEMFELGYAVTFHKSQGSQFPIVICVADRAANRVACRELWYVGLSRFESLLITVGELGVMYQQCQRVALLDRKTFLAERLREAIGLIRYG